MIYFWSTSTILEEEREEEEAEPDPRDGNKSIKLAHFLLTITDENKPEPSMQGWWRALFWGLGHYFEASL